MKGIQDCLNEGLRPSQRGDNWEIIKINWQHLKIFFSRTTGPISTKLIAKHPWIMGIQICSNEVPRPFPRIDDNEIAKLHWWKLTIFRTTGPIWTKLDRKFPWVKRSQFYIYGLFSFQKGDFFSLLISVMVQNNHTYAHVYMCLLIGTVFRVSEAAYGPLAFQNTQLSIATL